jgi:hypothetical protein
VGFANPPALSIGRQAEGQVCYFVGGVSFFFCRWEEKNEINSIKFALPG